MNNETFAIICVITMLLFIVILQDPKGAKKLLIHAIKMIAAGLLYAFGFVVYVFVYLPFFYINKWFYRVERKVKETNPHNEFLGI